MKATVGLLPRNSGPGVGPGKTHCPAELETNIKSCNEQACPEIIDCQITEECSKTCGGGERTCKRTCKNGDFGNGCDPAEEFKSENCNENDCPFLNQCDIDAISCSVTCGSGTKVCENTCENGQFGTDSECLEENRYTEEACNDGICPQIEECSDFSECTVSCGGGIKTCVNVCSNGGQWGVDCDENQKINLESCNLGSCPEVVECTDFSECSKTCGGGTKRCERSCSNGGIWGIDCDENDRYNEVACNENSCPEIEQCEITEPCSVTCGGGTKQCRNSCLNGEFGNGCDSNLEFTIEECNPQPCAELITCDIDSAQCSVTCGGGKKSCENTCKNGEFGVDPECLLENQFIEINCGESSCPEVIDCNNFSTCSKSCGGGEKTCERTCSNNGEWGTDCDPNLKIKTETCNDFECRK